MRKVFQIFICSVLCTMYITSNNDLYAVTAYPGLIEFVQPDGSTLKIYLLGDEKIKWAKTTDGYTIMFNREGIYEYAKLDSKGDMVPSGIKARSLERRLDCKSLEESEFLSKTSKDLFYSKEQISVMKQIWDVYEKEAKGFPTTGNRKLVCILMNFTDRTFVRTRLDFDNLYNQIAYNFDGATGSVKDYFLENSYNQLNLTVTVVGPYTAANNMAYYGANDASGNDLRPRELVTEAVNLANPDVNYADFDNDNDGTVDGVYVIFAGYDESAGGPANAIWAHKWQITPVVLDGKSISTYSCSSELRGTSGTSISRIGVICHEFGHVLGAPDFYDTNYATGGQFVGTGKWDLQADGSWNGATGGGETPAHSNPYSKIVLYNWATVNLLTQGQDVTLYNAAQNKTSFYRFNTATANEYYLCENRQLVGFDAALPGKGMIIYHVHSTVGTSGVNDGHPQRMYPVCATATVQQPTATPSTYGSINGGGCPFPGTGSKTFFTDNSTPWARSWASALTGKPVENITENTGNKTISFRFMGGPTCSLPTIQATNFTSSSITTNSMTAGWTRGNGNTVLVVARATGAVNSDPVIGTNYTANAAFGSGTQIGSGNYVVYKGTGTSVNVTSLASGTAYHYAVYEFNSADNCYKLPGLAGNATTVSVPIPPVANFTSNLTTIDPGGKIEFTETCTSNPTSWLWTFNGGFPSTSTSRTPEVTWVTSGNYTVSLTATNQYGSHTETKTNYVTVTSLPALPSPNPKIIGTGTTSGTYWPLGISTQGTAAYRYVRSASIFTSAEIGGGGEITKIEWQASAAQTDSRNIQIYLKHTTDVTFTASTVSNCTTGATLVYEGTFIPNVTSWFAFNTQNTFIYNGTSNLMVIALVHTTGAPGDKASNCYYTTAASKHQQWSGAAAPTGNGTVNGNRPNIRIAFSTPAAPVANFGVPSITPVLSEGFEGAAFPPTGWTINNEDAAGVTWAASTAHFNSGTKSAYHNYGASGYAEKGWLITKQLVLPAGQKYNLSFWSKCLYPGDYPAGGNSVRISTTNTALASFTSTVWTAPSVLEQWVKTDIDLSSFAGQSIYIAFRYQGTYAHSWALDDVYLSAIVNEPITVFEGDPVTIYDISTGKPFVWEWTTTGAVVTNSSEKDVTSVYNVAGLYPVTLKVGNFGGINTKTTPNFVSVLGRAPVADFLGQGNLQNDSYQQFIPVGGTVIYKDMSTRVPTAWSWTITGGTPATSTAQNPAVTYSNAGVYNASLTATNPHGTSNKSRSSYVKVGGSDFATNFSPDDFPVAYTMASGMLPGHCGDAAGTTKYFTEYAEYFPNSQVGQISHIRVGVNIAQGVGKNVTFNIWDGSSGEPGAVLASKTVAITSLSEKSYNIIHLDSPVNVTDKFFVGYVITYDATHNYTTHQFCSYLAYDRGAAGPASTAWGFISAFGGWDTMSSYMGMSTSLDVQPMFTYGTAPTMYQLTLNSSPVNGGATTATTVLAAGATISLTAQPYNGWAFVDWSDGGTPVSSTPTFNYTMPAVNKTLTANFAKVCAKPIPYYQYFTGLAALPTDWSTTGTPAWVVGTAATNGLSLGAPYAYATFTGTAANTSYMVSECFDFAGYKDIKISMRHKLWFAAAGNGLGTLAYSINGGVYTTIATFTVIEENLAWESALIPALQSQNNVRFRWAFTANATGTSTQKIWSVDNIVVSGITLPVIQGDVNGDGVLNVQDIVWMVNHIIGSTPPGFILAAADVNGDAVVDANDVVALVNLILSGAKGGQASVISTPGYITLQNDGIVRFESDGTLAALQFQLNVSNANEVNLSLLAEGYQLAYGVNENTITGIIYSPNNKAFDNGEIQLFSVNGASMNGISWGDVFASNIAAERVPVYANAPTGVNDIFSNELSVSVFPNPTTGTFTAHINMPSASYVEIQLTDILGRPVVQSQKSFVTKGIYEYSFDTGSAINGGVYIVRVLGYNADGTTVTQKHDVKLMVIRK